MLNDFAAAMGDFLSFYQPVTRVSRSSNDEKEVGTLGKRIWHGFSQYNTKKKKKECTFNTSQECAGFLAKKFHAVPHHTERLTESHELYRGNLRLWVDSEYLESEEERLAREAKEEEDGGFWTPVFRPIDPEQVYVEPRENSDWARVVQHGPGVMPIVAIPPGTYLNWDAIMNNLDRQGIVEVVARATTEEETPCNTEQTSTPAQDE